MTQAGGPHRKHPTRPTALAEYLPGALRDLGVPSARLTRRVADAWRAAADPAWQAGTVPLRLDGGVLIVGVGSAALRQELAQFHKTRLLSVMRVALPDIPLVALQFRLHVGGIARGEQAGEEA